MYGLSELKFFAAFVFWNFSVDYSWMGGMNEASNLNVGSNMEF